MLILKKLFLENFMSIGQLEMNFEENTMIGISGKNGEGKSALIYSIAFLLSGYRNGDTYENYVKAGTDHCFLYLNAFLNGEPLYCEAEISKKGRKGITTPVRRKTEYKGVTYINGDHSQFIKENELDYLEPLIFFFQDSSRDIIKARPGERAEILKKLFKFEFPDIVKNLKDNQEQNKTLQIQNNAKLEVLKKDLPTITPLLDEVGDDQIKIWKKEKKEAENMLASIGNIDELLLNTLSFKINDVDSQIKEEENKLSLSTSQINRMIRTLESLESFIQKNDLDDLNVKLSIKKEELEKHLKEFEENKKVLEELKDQKNIFDYEEKELEKQISISNTGVCHACGQSIGREHVIKLTESKDSVDRKIRRINNAISSLDFDIKDPKGKEIEKEIKEIENSIAEYLSSKKDYDVYLDLFKKEQGLEKERKERIKKLKEEREALQIEKSKQEEILPLISQKKELEAQLKNINDNLEEAKRISYINNERKILNEKIIEDQKKKEEEINILSLKANDILRDISETKTLLDIFESQFPSYLILQATKLLEDCLNEIIKRVFPYMNIKLQMQRTGVVFLYTAESSESEWLPISQASGAQKTILSLAYKTALARLHGISCIMLDEVDESCTPENSTIIYKFIASLQDFSQVIFISQRPESIEAAKEVNPNVVIYRVEKGEYTLESD